MYPGVAIFQSRLKNRDTQNSFLFHITLSFFDRLYKLNFD